MKISLFLLPTVALFFLLASCGQQNTGSLKITVVLPEVPSELTATHSCRNASEENDDFCIVREDTLELVTFSTDSLATPYSLDSQQTFRVLSTAGEEEFARTLRSNRYYKFFAKVVNKNGKVKLSGSTEGIYYQENKNYTVNLFLGLTGDLVRVSSIKKNSSSSANLLKEGASGAAAVVLKDGRVFLAGGSTYLSSGTETFERQTRLIDMTDLKAAAGPELREAVKDHAMALLDSATVPEGLVVIAFGKTQTGYSDKIYFFNPATETVEPKSSFSGRAHARALSINGEVYISGGCNADSAFADIIKIDKNGVVSPWKSMSRGRCLHGMTDISWYDGDGNFHPAILVFGGAKKYINAASDRSLVGYDENNGDFAEIIDENGSHKITLSGDVAGCSSDPDGTKLCFTLAGHGSVRVVWDNKNKGPAEDIVVVTAGGFLQAKETQDLAVSPSAYLLRGKKGSSPDPTTMSWEVSSFGSTISCAYASAAPISALENFPTQYAALNCGGIPTSPTVQRYYDTYYTQQMFVLEVRATPIDSNSDGIPEDFTLTASAKDSITTATFDYQDNGVFIDGPVVANGSGQAFLFGVDFLYLASGYSY